MPKMYHFCVNDATIPLIVSGEKSLEVVVAERIYKGIRRGHRITFNTKTCVTVVRVCGYLSFEEMLEKEGPEKIMPRSGKQRILQRLREIYPSAKENFGVLVFELQVDP